MFKGFIDMFRHFVDYVLSPLGMFCSDKKNCADVCNLSNRDRLGYICIRKNSDQPSDRLIKNAKSIAADIFDEKPEYHYLKAHFGVG